MPTVELVNGRKYVHMGIGKVFVKGQPREVTDDEAKLLLPLTGRLGRPGHLTTKNLFQLVGEAETHAPAPNGDGAGIVEVEQPIRRRGRPKVDRKPATVATVEDAMKASVASKAVEKEVKLEYVDDPAQPDN